MGATAAIIGQYKFAHKSKLPSRKHNPNCRSTSAQEQDLTIDVSPQTILLAIRCLTGIFCDCGAIWSWNANGRPRGRRHSWDLRLWFRGIFNSYRGLKSEKLISTFINSGRLRPGNPGVRALTEDFSSLFSQFGAFQRVAKEFKPFSL